ncbi:signal peptide peptidase SppA [Persicimonas caeni]|uniref:Signal peptide peptidase SppA n=1 Tax=Persicimonas caeni TaxID=2292766 RepID=A0A4Y6Q1I0_PERCE|nr:signal peptide peptidase SppA [Persicimonas caeni]QDG54436.1 signal peptide peptidase SppA [Persicimonas caeni]QED35657.1 signal peptide peptidase SppA [Persicimonas caeni]
MSEEPNEQVPTGDKDGVDKRGIMTVVVIFGGLFLMLLLFAVVMISAFSDDSGIGGADNQVGIIEVKGPIMESKKTVEDLRKFTKRDSIKGIVVRVDSPGGAVAPSQEIFQAVKRASKKKPVVVSMGSTAASGGYYIALGAEHIIANSGTVTGSIGVISQLFNVEGLLEKVDVQVNTVKTGKYKDAGSPFREFGAEDREYFRALLDDIYEQFIEDVAEARGLELSEVRKVADGRVFTGRQAKEYKLVDAIGTFQDAVDWVKDEAKIDGDAKLVYPAKEDLGFLSQVIEGATDTVVNQVRSRHSPVVEYRMAP